MKIIQEFPMIIEADNDKLLTDGYIYTDKVFLAINADPSEWYEVSKEEVPEDVRISIENHIPDESLV